MKVSIIVPIYKVESEIRRCLESVIQQDYLNIELILVNDSSPDSSFDIAEAIIREYSFQKKTLCISHSENKGLSVARNSGLKVATGEYIFFLDSDDELASIDTISYLVSVVKDSDISIDVVIGNFYKVLDNKILETSAMKQVSYTSNEAIFIAYSQLRFWQTACGKLIRYEFLDTNNITFKAGLYHEDELWFFNVVRKAKVMKVTPKVVYRYWERETSIMSTFTEKHVKDLNTIVVEMYKSYCQNRMYYPVETAVIIEHFRKLALERLFYFSDEDLILGELIKLRNIIIPPLQTGKTRYFKQNILLRMPVKFIQWYLKIKWEN